MKFVLKKIDTEKLTTPANYAKIKGIDRKVVYYLIKENVIDYIEIDEVKFIYLTEKSKNYKRRR